MNRINTKLVIAVILGIGMVRPLVFDLLAEEPTPPSMADPITLEMREAIGRANRIHNGMDQLVIDEAVATLNREIEQYKPEVFVPLAIEHLMRLAPKDTQTRTLLRRAKANMWLDANYVRALLVSAGDSPQAHIDALIQALDSPTPQERATAIRSLGHCGAFGKPALPKLREMVERAKADTGDFKRAYTSVMETPEHVLAHQAIQSIDSEINKNSAQQD